LLTIKVNLEGNLHSIVCDSPGKMVNAPEGYFGAIRCPDELD